MITVRHVPHSTVAWAWDLVDLEQGRKEQFGQTGQPTQTSCFSIFELYTLHATKYTVDYNKVHTPWETSNGYCGCIQKAKCNVSLHLLDTTLAPVVSKCWKHLWIAYVLQCTVNSMRTNYSVYIQIHCYTLHNVQCSVQCSLYTFTVATLYSVPIPIKHDHHYPVYAKRCQGLHLNGTLKIWPRDVQSNE